MKTIKILIFLCLTFTLSQSGRAQTSAVPGEVVAAISQGNASRLTAYLGANVELVIGSKNDVYSKQQAVEIIAEFFRKNTVADFQLLHSGNKDTSSFAIGTLKASTGTFRVYVLTRKAGGKILIQQLRIEPSNE